MNRNRERNRPGHARQATSPAKDPILANVITSSGITFQIWRLYQHAWLICLLFPLAQVVHDPLSPGHIVVRGLSLLGFAAGYTWVMWPHPASQRARAHPRFPFLILGLIVLLVFMLSLVYGPAWLWLLIGVSAMAGVLLPLRSAFAAVVFLTLLPLLLMLLAHRGLMGVDLWWLLAFVLLVRGVGLDMIGVTRMGSAIRELHTARLALARMKVEEERLRLARDLHDLLGQTLAVMTLKSELARGLITEDPVRCAQELAEVEQVGRMTLREVRRTVAGYRQPRLSDELDGARQVLEAAGIAFTIEQQVGELPPMLDAALAWTLREAVTNVIRHSRARHCLVRLSQEQGTVRLEVFNDSEQATAAAEQSGRQGSGLRGLRERVTMLGGTMEAGSFTIADSAHFRVCVTLPQQGCKKAAPGQEEDA